MSTRPTTTVEKKRRDNEWAIAKNETALHKAEKVLREKDEALILKVAEFEYAESQARLKLLEAKAKKARLELWYDTRLSEIKEATEKGVLRVDAACTRLEMAETAAEASRLEMEETAAEASEEATATTDRSVEVALAMARLTATLASAQAAETAADWAEAALRRCA